MENWLDLTEQLSREVRLIIASQMTLILQAEAFSEILKDKANFKSFAGLDTDSLVLSQH